MRASPSVEFVIGDDEDFVGDPQPATDSSRGRTVLIIVAVVIVGAALTVRGVAGGNHAPSRSVASSPSAPSPSPRSVHRPVRPAGCPAGATCDVVRTVPASTVTAVRSAFPKARLRSALSVVASEQSHFGSPLVARRVVFSFGGTNLSIAMTQRRCAETEAGDRVTRQYVGRITSTLLVKAVPGDVEGDIKVNDAGDGAQDAYCFLDSILVEQPRGDSPVKTVDLDRLAVDEALRSTG